MADSSRRRLDSWKEISTYLGRDVRTVARWERDRGLPVHRVPGGRTATVFAWSDEIDGWLSGRDAEPLPPPPAPAMTGRRGWTIGAIVILGVAAIAVMAGARPRAVAAAATLETRGPDLIARGADDAVAWTFRFDRSMQLEARPEYTAIDAAAGTGPSILTVLSAADDTAGRQALYAFTGDGRLQWRSEPGDSVTFGAGVFGAPWSSGAVVLLPPGSRARILWLTHHHTWWPGVARLLDERGREASRFVNPGWITSAAAPAPGVILLAGLNNAAGTNAFIVTDAASWPGTAPSVGSPDYACSGCPAGAPSRYFLLPRSELARIAGVPGEVTHIHPYGAATEVQTQQIPGDGITPSADFVFDFSSDYAPLRVRANDAYWMWHRRLEAEGRIAHSADACPERAGILVREWRRGAGWTDIKVGG